MLSNEYGVCVFKASIFIPEYDEEAKSNGVYIVNHHRLLGTGTAYEKENSTFINKTSYIENCETSAVGRALAMCGIGIDTSIASAEEVQNAINNQAVTVDDALNFVFENGKHKGSTIADLYEQDKKYLQWWLDLGNDERIKQMIMLITDMKPTDVPKDDKEMADKFYLMQEVMELAERTNTDYEKMLEHFGVESNSEMTITQLLEAKKVLEKKL